MHTSLKILTLFPLAALCGYAVGACAEAPPAAVRAVFEQHCVKCHSGDEPKGDMTLEPLMDGHGGLKLWQDALEKIETGEMPPKSKPRPAPEQQRAAVDWLAALVLGEKAVLREKEGRVVLRRLNRVEYENTLRDLLGVEVRVRELLPEDSSAAGFDNVGAALHSSSFLLARYLDAAAEALDQAIASGPQSAVKKQRVTLADAYQFKQDTEHAFRKRADGRITMFSSSQWQAATLFWLDRRGRYRFRMSVQGDQSSGKPVVFSTYTGGGSDGPKPVLAGYFDAPAEAPKVIEFEAFMEPRMSMTIRPYGLAGA